MTAIAIVGMGCRFAGAPDLQRFWEMTLAGRHAFTTPPRDRWDHAVFFDANRRATDRSYAPTGAFIDDVRSFSALQFGIPPRRAEVMDPQQRFAIEVAQEAIEDSGRTPAEMPHRTGVYMGVTATEFRTLMVSRSTAQLMASGAFGRKPTDPDVFSQAVENVVPSRPFSAAGVLANMNAAAVAQELDLHGPAYTLDAACASALIAVYDAVTQLRAGAIDAALAGGVYLCLTPEHHIAFSRIGAMSGSGVCRPFDHRADGFVQGDGAAVVVLKRLEDAVRDGDRVYAVLEGVALNNDGRGDGPMAPVEEGQRICIEAAWKDAGHDARDLGYIEAHGTGTDVGDGIEFRGLASTVGLTAKRAAIGSSKANVGHTMSTAGVAGLIRAALAVYHQTIPPMANYETAKAELGLAESPFFIPTAPEPWTAERRVATVSSFGFGGTNGHLVLSNAAVAPTKGDLPEVVLMSAADGAQLRDLAARTATAIRQDPGLSVAGIARAWAVRPPLAARLGLVARDLTDLADKLEAFSAGKPVKGVHSAEVTAEPKVAFLYPGQGAQRPGMLSGLRTRFHTVGRSLSHFDAGLRGELSRPLLDFLYPELRDVGVSAEDAMAELTLTENCQPALLACSIALTELLSELGVKPVVATGHSLGEFTAAAAAGVLDPLEAARFVALRGHAMAQLSGDHGAMAAVMASADEVRPLLVDGAVIANVNHPRQVVVSGFAEAVAQVSQAAEAAGHKVVALQVSHGFHSPALAGLDVGELVASLHLRDPQFTVASGIADHPYADAAEARGVFGRHATSPVDFVGALEQCRQAGATVFLQVGAGGPLASFARGTLPKGEATVLTLAGLDDHDQGLSLLETLAQLWALGVRINAKAVVSEAPVASVPPIPLPKESYWPVKDEVQMTLKIAAGSEAPAPRAQSSANTPSEAAPSGESDEVTAKVLAVVAKVSAYPLASLQASHSLVEDLGFDSLMMGDLASGLTDAFPGLGGIPQELLINRPTVQALVDHVKKGGSGSAGTDEDDLPVGAWAPIWAEGPFPSWDPPRSLIGSFAILGSGQLAEASRQALGGTGAQEVSAEAQPSIVVVAVDRDAYPSVGAVLAGEAAVPDTTSALVAALTPASKASRWPDVVVLVAEGQPWGEGPAGVVRALSRENTGRQAKVITVAPDLGWAEIGQRLLAELRSLDRSVDVRHSAAGREIRGFGPAIPKAGPLAGPGDVVVVTGGTRGIGAALAERIAETGAKLLLVGRSAPEALAKGLVDAGKAQWLAVDVTDAKALNQALSGEGVTQVVHAAGVLADGPLHEVDAVAGRKAVAVKVEGWINLVKAAGPSLKAIVTVGSWAGRLGSRHQAWYGAANAIVAGLSASAPRGLRAVCAEFGPWSESAMVQTIPAPVKAALRADGVDFVTDKAGLDALGEDLAGAQGVVVHGRSLPAVNRLVSFSETLDTATHPYLKDHAIDGVPVFPLASAADLIARTSCLEAPFEIVDLSLYSGVAVREPLKITVTVRGERAEIRQGDKAQLAYTAKIRKLRSRLEPIARREGGEAPATTLEAFYSGLTFHGPLLQGLAGVDGVGEGFARGRVRTGSPKRWVPGTARERFSVDPLALDSAMQLSGLVAWDRYRRAGTPVRISRLVVLSPFPPEGTELVVETTFGDQQGDKFVADIAFYDADGKLVALALGTAADLKAVESGVEAPIEIKREWIDASEWQAVKDLKIRLEMATATGIRNPYFTVHEGTAKNTTVVGGRELINFSSYNYIGLSGDPEVLDQVYEAARRYGTSVSASRVASGERPFHGELERELADAQGSEAALLFTAGHATNVTTIGHLFGPQDLILHDELIHDSALQGIKLSGAARRSFRHDDPRHLESQLKELRKHYQKVLIVVEGVYSMDGDICDLPAYVALKKKYGCLLMVDEAHSFGIVGETGRGVAEHFGIPGKEIDIWMGTLSKSLASCGGWIAGSEPLVTYLRYSAPGFVYSAGLTPANGMAALASLRKMLKEPWRVKKLQSNAHFYQSRLKSLGIDTGPALGESGVVPVVTGNSLHALVLSGRLLDKGINIQPIVYPAVPDNAARLRCFLSSTHTEEQLAFAADTIAATLAEVRKEFPA